MDRDAFIDKACGNGVNESGGTIAQQIRRMGSSLDWSRDRFTMDEVMPKQCWTVFERLYDDGPDL